MGRGGARVQASSSGHTPHGARRPVPAVAVFPQNTLISTQMALPGTLSWQLAAPLTHWHPQLEFPRTAGPRPTFLMSGLPRLSLTPYFPSLRAGTDPLFPLPRSATGGTYLPLLGGWTSRTRHKHGAADESWLVLARCSEQWLTQRAPWPRSVPARLSPTSAGGPERTSPGNRRHPAGSRLIAPGWESHTPRSRHWYTSRLLACSYYGVNRAPPSAGLPGNQYIQRTTWSKSTPVWSRWRKERSGLECDRSWQLGRTETEGPRHGRRRHTSFQILGKA